MAEAKKELYFEEAELLSELNHTRRVRQAVGTFLVIGLLSLGVVVASYAKDMMPAAKSKPVATATRNSGST